MDGDALRQRGYNKEDTQSIRSMHNNANDNEDIDTKTSA